MNSEQLQKINSMVQQDLATSRQLLALLEEETSATKDRNYATLSQCLEEKTPLLEQLQNNAQTRSEWLKAMGKKTDEQGWLSLVNSSQEKTLQQQWQEVKKTIEHCQRINSINGKLINRGLTSHSRLLQIMRGNMAPTDLYDARGERRSTSLSGNVTQA